MSKNNILSKSSKHLIGMVHVQALPGTPKNQKSPQQIIEQAVQEALVLKSAGFDALLIENMHDAPYLNAKAGHEISTLMAIIGYEIKKETGLPVGIQILAGANEAAMAAAYAANLDFIRAEGFVFGHMADEGFMESCAGTLLRYRKQLGAEKVNIFTDIKKKHASHALTADVSIAETAKAAEFFLSDGIIVSGNATGQETSKEELRSLQNITSLPLIIGSGITLNNIAAYLPLADAFIIGSSLKKQGKWFNAIDLEYCQKLVNKVKSMH